MKKIYIGGFEACSVHNEKYMLNLCVSKSYDYGITGDNRDADIIVIIDTCMATYNSMVASFEYLEEILEEKKYGAKVIVSGCLVKGTNFELLQKYRDILDQVTCVQPDNIIEYISRLVGLKLDSDLLNDFKTPYSLDNNMISISPVSGCLNQCSFCKSNYMNFPLKSIPFENLEGFSFDIDNLNGHGYTLNCINITSSNLSLYGVDLYGRQRAHEAIRVLTSSDIIKFAEVGALINFYPELIDEILNNSKIKSIFISLESGSERIYNLMNRPISLDKLKEIIKLIRINRPDIIINTEFICGFPTETLDDLKKTIDLVYKLDINPQFIHTYENSHCIPSSQLPQHSLKYCDKMADYAINKVKKLRNKFSDVILNGEMLVLNKSLELGLYEVMLINGDTKIIGFDEVDREYEINDIIPVNKIKCKKRIRKR